MERINNDPQQVLLRKSRNNLIVMGSGIILFGVWTAFKMLAMLVLLKDETIEGLRKMASGVNAGATGEWNSVIPEDTVYLITMVLVALFMALALCARAYVGMSAISEGRGKRKRSFYLVVAAVIICFNMASFILNFISVNEPEQMGAFTRDTSFSGLIIEFTSMVMLIEMLVSAIRARQITGR